jgi:hypothetical protein
MTRSRSDDPEFAQVALRRRYRTVSFGKHARLVLAGAALLVVLGSAVAQAAPPVGFRVALTACPHAGTTVPCLTINGADGSVYNISAATPKPPLNGRMIRLRATVSDKLSACLQGIVLDRIRWTPVRQKCTN